MNTLKNIVEKQFDIWDLLEFKRGEKGIKPLARATFAVLAREHYSANEIADFMKLDADRVYKFIRAFKRDIKSPDKRHFLLDKYEECKNLYEFTLNREEILREGFEILDKDDSVITVKIKDENDFMNYLQGLASPENYSFDYNHFFFRNLNPLKNEHEHYDPEHYYKDIRGIQMLNYKGLYFDLWSALGKFSIDETTETVIVEISKELEKNLTEIAQDIALRFIQVQKSEGFYY